MSEDKGFSIIILVAAVVGLYFTLRLARYLRLRRLLRNLSTAESQLAEQVRTMFLVEACNRCAESEMELVEISPNARSVAYRCVSCSARRRWAKASTERSIEVLETRERVERLLHLYTRAAGSSVESSVSFQTVEPVLPYERSCRSPVPQKIKDSVWRRDNGSCVHCGSKHNLEFDHIIPVSKGGGNSVRNVQILCQMCNRVKASSI